MDRRRPFLKQICLILILILNADSATINRNLRSDTECTLPNHPANGEWTIFEVGSSSQPRKTARSGSILSVTCKGPYTLKGPSFIECKNGKWTAQVGECSKMCPPIITTKSTKVTCNSDGKSLDDCRNALNGTIATFKCAPFYENSELNRNPFRICRNGSWSQDILTCTPVCGIKPEKSSINTNYYFSWNAAIYKYAENKTVFSCVGTLINERIILTAANCITDQFGNKKPTNHYTVAAGKSVDLYEDPRDPEAQYSDLVDMFVPEEYKGQIRKYTGDIAVLVTRNAFNMSRRIQPACLDWKNKYKREFEFPKIAGSIAGPLASRFWPELKQIAEVEIPFVNDTECYNQLSPTGLGSPNFEALYSDDKLCTGYINSDRVPKCRMDHGVGLISKNQYDNKYYLSGILSSFPSIHRENCDNKRWALFTKVSKYIPNFIVEKSNLYTTVDRSYFQPSCGVKSVQAQTLIVNGNPVVYGDYPWQVAIYRIERTRKLICGGSLITRRVILTAAHCVTNAMGNVKSKELFVVAVGKYYRDFDDGRDTNAQFSPLKDIFVPDLYKGHRQNYFGDIAVLVTENSFVLSKYVEPVCVDWSDKYEKQFLGPSATGFVTGWGFTKQNAEPSDLLKDLEVPYVDYDRCIEMLPDDYDIYLTSDKMCSGFSNQSKSVCKGDSGGGLVFKNINDGRYYIAGIVSLSPRAPTGGCDSNQFTLYTKVSNYVKSFILEKVQLYWA